jgi:hypothetical protein
VRFDVAYNGYDRQPGALYMELNDALTLLRTGFTQPRPNHWTYHFSFQQPF